MFGETVYLIFMNIGRKGINELVEKIQLEKDWRNRERAVRILGYMREEAILVVSFLTKVLKEDSHWYVRAAASLALGRIADKQVVNALVEQMKNDDNWRVRLNSTWALMEMNAKETIKIILTEINKEKNHYGKFYMAYSLAILENTTKGMGIKIIKEMKENNDLAEWEINEYMELYRELEFQEKIKSLEKEVKSFKDSTIENLDKDLNSKLINSLSILSDEFSQLTSDYKELTKKSLEKRSEKLHPKLIPCFKLAEPMCPKDIAIYPNQVFMVMPFKEFHFYLYETIIVPILEEKNFLPIKADDEIKSMDLMCHICQTIRESMWAIVDISEWNVNVLFELGLIWGFGKVAILIKNQEAEVPADLKGMIYISYKKDELNQFKIELSSAIDSIYKQ